MLTVTIDSKYGKFIKKHVLFLMLVKFGNLFKIINISFSLCFYLLE
jgi:hypothetical protein